MDIVRILEEGRWREFLEDHPRSNVFHTPEIYHMFDQVKGYKPELWAAVEGDNRPLALFLPVTITLHNGIFQTMTTRAVSYGSVLCEESRRGRDALSVLLKAYTRSANHGALFTELRNVSDMSSLHSVLDRCGFEFEDHLNYLIPLGDSPDVLMGSFSGSMRKRIRRAIRQGKVTITEVSDQADLALCYEQMRKSYANAKVPLVDKTLFDAAFQLLLPKGMVKFLLAWIGDECVAGSAELIFRDTIYGWYGGVDRDFSAYVPNELLMWHILKWGVENSFSTYDFGGAGRPGEDYGVRDFKSKFGGKLVNYGRNVYTHSPVKLAISKVGYEVYRRVPRLI